MTFFYKDIPVGFSDTGAGPAVLLLHGFLENQLMWQPFIPDLAHKKQRVITIDLLGHGKSGCVGYVHTMEEHAQMVKALLDYLKLRKAILIGHSMGGYVALAFAELYPEAVKGIMLVNSTTTEDNLERKENRDRAIIAVKQNHTAFIKMAVGNLFSSKNREKLQVRIQQMQLEALKTSLQGIIASLEGMKVRKDRGGVLKRRTFPACIVLGEEDEILPIAPALSTAKELNLEIMVLPDGHMSFIENEADLLEAIQHFLRLAR